MRLFRYLEKRYVESFFETGRLMLSSFERCRRHEDARGDSLEGKGSFTINTNARVINGLFNVGENTHILSTSRILSTGLMKKFNVDDYFVIKDPERFAHAISECLPSVESIHMDDCIYSDPGFGTSSREYSGGIPENFGELSETEMISWFENQNKNLQLIMQNSLGNRGLFLKRRADYHDEEEFRFAWVMSNPVDELLLIECKDAVRYCEYR